MNKLYANFLRFHQENPHVYKELVRLAYEQKARGRRRIGIGMLYEVVRWNLGLHTYGEEDYKLCNNHRAFYSRLIEQNEPSLKGFFPKKASVADGKFDKRCN